MVADVPAQLQTQCMHVCCNVALVADVSLALLNTTVNSARMGVLHCCLDTAEHNRNLTQSRPLCCTVAVVAGLSLETAQHKYRQHSGNRCTSFIAAVIVDVH